MKNPFTDFSSLPFKKKEIPLESILVAKKEVVDHIIESYLQLVEQEAKDLVWLVEHSRVVKAYETAVEGIGELQYDQDDIEEFCAELDRCDKIPYMIAGPAGIFVSALINKSPEQDVVLKLQDYQRTFHFLGCRLPQGKTLVLQGNLGDFIGAGLAGGRLIIEGSVGSWCGAGMIKGEIMVNGHTGQKTGDWMRGGEIHVDGQIQSVGKTRFGGKIFRQGKPVIPHSYNEYY